MRGRMRGSIQGSFWGLVLGGSGLAATFVLIEQPRLTEVPQTPLLVAPTIVAASQAIPKQVVIAPEMPVTLAVDVARLVMPDAVDTTPVLVSSPTYIPKALVVTTMTGPTQGSKQPRILVSQDLPRLATFHVAVLTRPSLADDIIAVPKPARRTEPTTGVPEPTLVADLPRTPLPADVAVTVPAIMSAQDEDEEEIARAPAPVIIEPAPSPEEVPLDTDIVAETPPPPALQISVPVSPTTRVSVIAPSGRQTLPQVNASVRVNRPGADPVGTAESDPVVVTDPGFDGIPALQRFSAPFENPKFLPMLGIILVDDGRLTDGPAALADLGFAPTVALDALSPDAQARMAAYRREGIEIAMQTALPAEARPVDVEVTFAVALASLDEATMLVSDGMGVLQTEQDVMEQVVAILAAEGRGFATMQSGFGNAVRVAEQADVPATTIMRDLNRDGDSKAALLRALDQAAFRARQSGSAVLMGTMSTATLDGLREWAEQVDDDQLVLSPVSAILLAAGQ